MGRLEVGKLALTFGLINRPEYNGKCVELIYFLPKNQENFIVNHPLIGTGFVESDPEDWWVCKYVNSNEIVTVRPRNLMPIDDSDPDEIISKEKEKENEH